MGNIIISRNASQQSALSIDRMADYNIGGIGSLTGSGTIVATRNNAASDRTVIQFQQEDENAMLEVSMTDTKNEIWASGNNVGLGFERADVAKDVTWDVKGGALDLSNSTKNNTVVSGENSSNSIISLGSGNDKVKDSGSYNVFFANGGNNIFETTRSSEGAVIYGSNKGNDTYNISGAFGVMFAGNGNNTFNLEGDKNMNGAFRNVIFGGAGQNTVWNRGAYGLFLGGSGVNNINENGSHNISTTGNNPNSSVNFWPDSVLSNAFKNVQDAETNMRVKDWTFDDFMDYSGHNDNITKSFVEGPLYSVLPK